VRFSCGSRSRSFKQRWLHGSRRPARQGRSIVIDLKTGGEKAMENRSGYPNAFPRTSVKKVFENDRVIVWDYSWTRGQPTAMHFHDKDVVVVYLEDGALMSTTPDGQKTLRSSTTRTPQSAGTST
jgi:hypothetical protein